MSRIQSVRNKQSESSRRTYKQSKKRKHSNSAGGLKTSSPAASHTRRIQRQKQRAERRLQKKPRRRLFPIWLRIVITLLFCGLALILGTMIGYGVLGDGVPADALKKETWQHIIDFVKKEN